MRGWRVNPGSGHSAPTSLFSESLRWHVMASSRVGASFGVTCAVIIEEGFPRERLERLYASMRAACDEAGTTIVTGDTKVVER